MDENEEIVATGTWLYDNEVPRPISVMRKPAQYADSRYDWENDRWNDDAPIPATIDGFVYYCSVGASGEHLSVEDAKVWASNQSWGPVNWSKPVS